MQMYILVQCPTEAAHGVTSGRMKSGKTFRRVIAGIRENPVDLLFIAGDLFHRQPLPYELKEVNELFSGIPETRVYLMAGERDYLKENSFYRTFTWAPNVTFFPEEKVTPV